MSTDVFAHPWLGGLFGDPEAAAIWEPGRQMSHMLRIEAAYTRALGEVGDLPKDKAHRAASAIEASSPDMDSLAMATARDGLPVPDLVRQIKDAAGADADAIHTGMTSQDVIDTALALSLRDLDDLLATRLSALSGALTDLCGKFGAIEIMGRTRMQAALPIPAAHRVTSWSRPVASHRERLSILRPRVERLQLGGPVGDRASLGGQSEAIARLMARELGLAGGPAWHAQREALADHASLLSLISGTLGKMGQDICLMSQQGIDEVQIRDAGGSSAMPHKQNPVTAELLVTLARFNATQVAGMHHALVHEQERSGAAWGLEWMILPQMAMAAARSLSAASDLSCRITIRKGQAG